MSDPFTELLAYATFLAIVALGLLAYFRPFTLSRTTALVLALLATLAFTFLTLLPPLFLPFVEVLGSTGAVIATLLFLFGPVVGATLVGLVANYFHGSDPRREGFWIPTRRSPPVRMIFRPVRSLVEALLGFFIGLGYAYALLVPAAVVARSSFDAAYTVHILLFGIGTSFVFRRFPMAGSFFIVAEVCVVTLASVGLSAIGHLAVGGQH